MYQTHFRSTASTLILLVCVFFMTINCQHGNGYKATHIPYNQLKYQAIVKKRNISQTNQAGHITKERYNNITKHFINGQNVSENIQSRSDERPDFVKHRPNLQNHEKDSYFKNKTQPKISLNIAQSNVKNVSDSKLLIRNRREVYRTVSAVMQHCPGVDVSQASICPWVWEINTDPRRRPRQINIVNCNNSRSSIAGLECRPVMANITIKRYNVAGGWVIDSEYVSQGCTPVVPCS